MKEDILIAIDELQRQLYGRSSHCDYLSGRLETFKRLVRELNIVILEYEDEIKMLDWIQEQVLIIAHEFEDWKSSKPSYSAFGG